MKFLFISGTVKDNGIQSMNLLSKHFLKSVLNFLVFGQEKRFER